MAADFSSLPGELNKPLTILHSGASTLIQPGTIGILLKGEPGTLKTTHAKRIAAEFSTIPCFSGPTAFIRPADVRSPEDLSDQIEEASTVILDEAETWLKQDKREDYVDSIMRALDSKDSRLIVMITYDDGDVLLNEVNPGCDRRFTILQIPKPTSEDVAAGFLLMLEAEKTNVKFTSRLSVRRLGSDKDFQRVAARFNYGTYRRILPMVLGEATKRSNHIDMACVRRAAKFA